MVLVFGWLFLQGLCGATCRAGPVLTRGGVALTSLCGVLFRRRPLALSSRYVRGLRRDFRFLGAFSGSGVVCNVGANFKPVTRCHVRSRSLSRLRCGVVHDRTAKTKRPLPRLCIGTTVVTHLCAFLRKGSNMRGRLTLLVARFVGQKVAPCMPRRNDMKTDNSLMRLTRVTLALVKRKRIFCRNGGESATSILTRGKLRPFGVRVHRKLSIAGNASMVANVNVIGLVCTHRLVR